MICNIILDVGMVLVAWEPEKALRALGMDERALNQVANATVRSADWNETDRSALSDEEQHLRMIGNAPEFEREIRLFLDNIQLAIRQYDYSRPWIQTLKKNGYRVYILSNYARWTYAKTTEALSFLEDVDGALFSFQVHQIKPEPEIYQTMLQKFDLNVSECVFLDDRAENIKAAKAQGMCGIHFTSYEQAVRELKEYGVVC